MRKKSGAQFDPFTRGRIVGLAEAGVTATVIASKVRKTDNSRPKPDAVRKTIRKFSAKKKWKGERTVGSGRPVPS